MMAVIQLKGLAVGATQLAHVFGVSLVAVGKMEKKGLLSKNKEGKYPLCESVQAYIASKKQKKTNPDNVYEAARAKKMTAAAEIEQMNLAIKKGELVDIDAVVDIVKTEYAIVRQRLFTIPNKMALDVFACETPEQVQELLLIQFNEALDELKYDIGREVDGSEGESPEALAETQLS